MLKEIYLERAQIHTGSGHIDMQTPDQTTPTGTGLKLANTADATETQTPPSQFRLAHDQLLTTVH